MKMRLQRIVPMILGVAFSGMLASGQDIRRAEPARGAASSFGSMPSQPSSPYSASAIERSGLSGVPVDPNHRLSPNDIVSVQIQEDREPPVAKKVSATGELDMAPYGRFRVAGKTTSQAESDLKAFLERDYYYKATVSVALETVNPVASLKKVTVSGQVRAPSTIEFAAGESVTLSEAILRVGNFTQWAKKDKVHLFRNGSDRIYDVGRILERGLVADDPVLQDGDRISVEKNWFNIKGD